MSITSFCHFMLVMCRKLNYSTTFHANRKETSTEYQLPKLKFLLYIMTSERYVGKVMKITRENAQ
jgi:hypothetical protein